MKFRSLLAALLFPASMTLAAITGADRGTGANSNSEASTTITPGSNFTTGAMGILCWHGDNAVNSATNTPASITDSAGNIWYRRGTLPVSGAGANASVESAIYTAILSNGLTTGGSIVMTYTTANVTAKAWTLTEAVAGTAGTILITRGYGNTTIAASTGQQGTSGVMFVGEMCLWTNGAESPDTYTGDSDTTNGTWSTKQSIGTGTGATGMSTMSQYKIQTTTASTQTFDPVITSADNVSNVLQIAEVPAFTRLVTTSTNTSDAANTLTFTNAIAQNSQAVMCVAADNNNATGPGAVGNFPSTLTDSKSNTWTLRQNTVNDPGIAGAGVEIGIYTAPMTTALAVGDTVTITYVSAAIVAKTFLVFEFADATGYTGGNVGSPATTATPSLTTSSIANGHYVVAMVGAESTASFNGFTADTDTTNGTWSPQAQACSNGIAVTGMTITAQYKKVTATATQSYDTAVAIADLVTSYVDMTAPALGTTTKLPAIPAFPSIPSL